MELHSCLWHEVQAFNFQPEDLDPIPAALPGCELIHHSSAESFLANSSNASILLTWEFPVSWYEHCRNLKLILTPAAGQDWIEYSATGEPKVIHGTFHGEILAESLLSAILYMNHQMPGMLQNFRDRQWNRDLQLTSRLLRDQTVLIIGYGNIGERCGQLIRATGASVIGVRRDVTKCTDGTPVYSIEKLEELLPKSDHVVLILPGNESTERFMNIERLQQCKPGAVIYNFGRGNALYSEDLVRSWDHLGGAFLDVTDVEPLPEHSPLWQLDNVMITPHSSCIYENYRQMFVEEAIQNIKQHYT